ncbi:monoamine oxidase-like protein A [Setomelanomma holmii]|uniref:Amine oxidase n=1 Tax=Setomelanomma holmii TaxID=210430 RepID=A0A9P4LSP3_9PLEO|nr:monoamine oxidase-like protein A [Setomelanomma holmii]
MLSKLTFRHHFLPFLLFSCLTNAHPLPLPEQVDIAIIGAGLSRLPTAHHLLSSSNKSVLILEAHNRVGGKVYNAPLKNGGVSEVGAEFVGPTQDAVLALINELGLETFHKYNEGKNVLWRNGSRLAYTANPTLGVAPPLDMDALRTMVSSQASVWDNKTLVIHLAEATPLADANFFLSTASKAIFAAEPREISLLYVLAYIASAGNATMTGGLNRLIAVTNGAQEERVVGGTGLIPQRLANKVGYEHIALNAAVNSITKTSTGYRITSRRGTICAKSVVFAMAPPLLKQIHFDPALPTARQALNTNTKMPTIGKGVAIYSTPFWRSQSGGELNAEGAQPTSTCAVRVTFDSAPSNSTSESFGAILGFILGDEMRALDKLPASATQDLILKDYNRYYGASAKNITEFVLCRWDLEEWSRGGPAAIAPPGVLSRYGAALRESVDGLHFAGTETSEYWTGYMDGAIRSGERVAKGILGG